MKYTLLLLLLPILSLAQRTEDEAYRIIREALAHPESITELDLSGYGINYLPPEIGQFTNLEKLWLQHNRLSELPPSIGNLNKLTHLSLEANSIWVQRVLAAFFLRTTLVKQKWVFVYRSWTWKLIELKVADPWWKSNLSASFDNRQACCPWRTLATSNRVKISPRIHYKFDRLKKAYAVG